MKELEVYCVENNEGEVIAVFLDRFRATKYLENIVGKIRIGKLTY